MGKKVKLNNIQIWYEEFGDSLNESILLIMGANANCKHWDQEFIDQLVSNNFHVIRFDNRDVGKSTWIGKEPGLNKILKFFPAFLLKLIVNSIFGLAVDDKGKFKFIESSSSHYDLSDMAKDAVSLMNELILSALLWEE
jgi:pimeloyl-ACP methyl ester carboxylesterase